MNTVTTTKIRERHMKEEVWSTTDLLKSIGALCEKLKATSPSTAPFVAERKEYIGLQERHKSDKSDENVTRKKPLAFYDKFMTWGGHYCPRHTFCRAVCVSWSGIQGGLRRPWFSGFKIDLAYCLDGAQNEGPRGAR